MIAEINTLTSYKYCQKTFQNSISCVGVGLHSGQKVHMTFYPADVDTGIVFKRVDVTDKDNLIPALYMNVSDTRLNSCISNAAGVYVSTIEHLMAALHGFGISNAIIEVDGPEAPLLDGSALDYVTLFECAGVIEQDAPLKAVKIKKEVVFEDGKGAEVCLYPAEEGLEMDFMIDFVKSRAIGRQEYSITLSPRTFKDSIAYARTFGFAHEVEALRSMGLARGGTLDNCIVVEGDTILNPEGLRSENEFVVHKTLDAVGDLYQLGMPVIGHFCGVKSGHAHTNALLRKLMADKSAYEIVEMDAYMADLIGKRKKSA